ncbi:glyoxylase-like metal-dependent hydrolase (beta-lactamase superfamily II) [Salirhabdus euzebyi]|uniref:Glyoxylase-like metal-dependent hydrolase (Beta-lactamase superfamily II) n=1 Tax=Salirhabdus euzebyi TaxID=394506 RepID=A0A841Q448_9BACI|nr:MBL fold metallo-hydrolase [Salirhabdus euzebyi]MBB6453191.1 glyoxylase-like metal-dependent hydrolase (beta-lactamase superfamily II) [Salirhabdus euzebyi]
MLVKITENIYKLIVHFPTGMKEANCYLIKGDKGYTVIDTGTNSKEAKESWEKVLADGLVVEKVVLTHTHEDHIGLARWFKEDVGVPVYVSDLGYHEMRKFRDTDVREKRKTLVLSHGGPEITKKGKDASFIYDFEPDGLFTKGDKLKLGEDFYEAIWTPGHAPDHFCFYNKEQRLILIGDHILKHISPVIGLWSGEEGNPLGNYFSSLNELTTYPIELALPGHGEIIENLQERIENLKERHEQRLAEVLEAINNEWKTAEQLCKEMYGTLNIILNFSAFMASLTRLLYLESIGKAKRKEVNGIIKFKQVY